VYQIVCIPQNRIIRQTESIESETPISSLMLHINKSACSTTCIIGDTVVSIRDFRD